MRYVTMWRKLAPDFLDWDFHVSADECERDQVIKNITERGVKQYEFLGESFFFILTKLKISKNIFILKLGMI